MSINSSKRKPLRGYLPYYNPTTMPDGGLGEEVWGNLSQRAITSLIRRLTNYGQYGGVSLEQLFDLLPIRDYRTAIINQMKPDRNNIITECPELNPDWAEIRIEQIWESRRRDSFSAHEITWPLLNAYVLNYYQHYPKRAQQAAAKGRKIPWAERAIAYLGKIAGVCNPESSIYERKDGLYILLHLCDYHKRWRTADHPDPYWTRTVRNAFFVCMTEAAHEHEEWWEIAKLITKCALDRDDQHLVDWLQQLETICETEVSNYDVASWKARESHASTVNYASILQKAYERLAWIKPAIQQLSDKERLHPLWRQCHIDPECGGIGTGWNFLKDIKVTMSDWQPIPAPTDTPEQRQHKPSARQAVITVEITLSGTCMDNQRRYGRVASQLEEHIQCHADGAGSVERTSSLNFRTEADPESDQGLQRDIVTIEFTLTHHDSRKPARWRLTDGIWEHQYNPELRTAASKSTAA